MGLHVLPQTEPRKPAVKQPHPPRNGFLNKARAMVISIGDVLIWNGEKTWDLTSTQTTTGNQWLLREGELPSSLLVVKCSDQPWDHVDTQTTKMKLESCIYMYTCIHTHPYTHTYIWIEVSMYICGKYSQREAIDYRVVGSMGKWREGNWVGLEGGKRGANVIKFYFN